MKYKEIKEGIFLARPNRFIARVVVDGEEQTVHVKNTGRCKELLLKGVKVFLEDHGDGQKTRKTRYSLVALEKARAGNTGFRLINIDSYAPNRAVGEALACGGLNLPGLDFPLARIKPEATFGASRFDFYVEDREGTKAYIEVKGVTLEEDGVVRFPDAPTERGVKHIKELGRALDLGFLAYIVFVIQMKDVDHFEPNDETHPAFGAALREAVERGVVILARDCDVTADSMVLGKPVPVKL
ncbi:MAG TPA: DNA/RNA nuclease SfsA [Bacillota bacterium]|nr:DNA/RNA nuclease SfsA [Bacillota bacterium]